MTRRRALAAAVFVAASLGTVPAQASGIVHVEPAYLSVTATQPGLLITIVRDGVYGTPFYVAGDSWSTTLYVDPTAPHYLFGVIGADASGVGSGDVRCRTRFPLYKMNAHTHDYMGCEAFNGINW